MYYAAKLPCFPIESFCRNPSLSLQRQMCDNIILGLALEMNKRKTGSMSRTFMTNKDYPGHADFATVTAGKDLAEMGLGLR